MGKKAKVVKSLVLGGIAALGAISSLALNIALIRRIHADAEDYHWERKRYAKHLDTCEADKAKLKVTQSKLEALQAWISTRINLSDALLDSQASANELKDSIIKLQQHTEFLLEEASSYPCFDDLWQFSSAAVQRIIAEIEFRDFALALSITSQRVLDTVRANVSLRYWNSLNDEIKMLKRSRKVADTGRGVAQEAKERITAVIRRLRDVGEICLNR